MRSTDTDTPASLFEHGFPYTHDLIKTEQDGSQLKLAKSKSATVRQDLKRVLDDATADSEAKRRKADDDSKV